jgi:PD-(D/E)XK nuclease superfamily protein/antidote-toxin recognition MazE-like antitoxin
MFEAMPSRLKPREQGDVGELSAMEWLASQGACIYIPLGHSPDVDLIAAFGDRLLRIQVKTSTCHRRERWAVVISTRGGNQSWSGLVKYFDPDRCDYLFVHVGDGRRWFIPTRRLESRSGLNLGGRKYSEFEIEPGRPLARSQAPPALESRAPGEYPSGQRGGAVNAMAMPSQVRILPPPSVAPHRSYEATGSRKDLRIGRARIWGKGQITIPAGPRRAAGLEVGDDLYVETRDDGTLLVTRIANA